MLHCINTSGRSHHVQTRRVFRFFVESAPRAEARFPCAPALTSGLGQRPPVVMRGVAAAGWVAAGRTEITHTRVLIGLLKATAPALPMRIAKRRAPASQTPGRRPAGRPGDGCVLLFG